MLAPLHSLAAQAPGQDPQDPGSLLARSLQQLDRIDSLSEQISFLEEQLGSCEYRATPSLGALAPRGQRLGPRGSHRPGDPASSPTPRLLQGVVTVPSHAQGWAKPADPRAPPSGACATPGAGCEQKAREELHLSPSLRGLLGVH